MLLDQGFLLYFSNIYLALFLLGIDVGGIPDVGFLTLPM
jgi:hypothetical protein